MPSFGTHSVLFLIAPLLLLLCACHGGGGSTDDPDVPLSNVDLAVTSFTVSPPAADPEDVLTLSGTIQNLGTETANPVLGDKFLVAFNLSVDGTFELNEQGFLQKTIDAPIPPGESLDFTWTGSYSHGDTLSHFTVFCSGTDADGSECVPPETGVIGVKADFANDIGERDEGNNFQFMPIEVVGTRVGSTFGGCDSDGGCDLRITDGLEPPYFEHRPAANLPASQVVYPNQLLRYITVSVIIVNCLAAQVPGGSCGGSWTIVGTTQKPGLSASTKTLYLPCRANYLSTGATCTTVFEIRDPGY